MLCHACQHDNRVGARFCEACGAELARSCAACGAALSPTARFCSECGQAADPALGAQKAAPAAPPANPESYTPAHLAQRILTTRAALEGERKQVTVLFCDIANSTALSHQLGAEAMHGVLNRFFERALDQVHRYEGTVNQFLGDGFMALFGAPLAHEDHARRAVLAALGIQQVMAGTSDELRLRIGINTGPVVVGRIGDNLRMDYTAVGDTTNMAARLQQHAQPGQTLIGEASWRLLGGAVRGEPLSGIELKGIGQPVTAYRITGIHARRSPLAGLEERALSRFVGREREVAALTDALAQARAGHGQVVGIVGEPGVGKSRLLHEFRQSLGAHKLTYLEGRCVSYGKAIPYLPLQEIVRANCGVTDADSTREIGAKVRAALDEVDIDADARTPFILYLFGVKEGAERLEQTGPETIKARIFETVRQMSLNGARKRPLVVSVEDLHWIDGVSEEYFASVVDAIADVPILLLTTYRPGYAPPWIDRSFATQIALRPLAESDSLSVVESVEARASKLPEEQVRAVIAKAEGNPFFLEELTRALAEGESNTIPDTVQGVLAARIDRLPEAARRLLQNAAVLGRGAPLRLLEAICDEPDKLEQTLQILKRAELMHERSGVAEPDIAFKHALTQEVAYDSLLSARKQALHELAGRAIERLYGQRLEQHYELLAHHYTRTTDTGKALDYLERALAKAAKKYALLEAKGYFDQANAILLELPETTQNVKRRVLLLHRMQPVMLPLLRMPEYDELLQAARLPAERVGDPGTLGALYGALGHCQWSFGQPDAAQVLAERAVELCQQGGLVEEEGYARCLLTWIYAHQVRPELAIAAKEPALAVVEREFNLRWYVWALLAPAWAEIMQCRFDDAERDASAALRAGEEHADQSVVSISAVVLCDLSIYRGDLGRALDYAQLAMENTPTPFDQVLASGQYHFVRCLLGEADGSLEQLESISGALRQSGFFPGERWTVYLTQAYLRLGRPADARETLLGMRAAYPNVRNHLHATFDALVLGDAYVALGGAENLTAAEAEYRECLRMAEPGGIHKWTALCDFGLGRIRAAQGRIDEAREHFTKALERLERHGILLEPERVRAELAKLPAAHR